MRLWLISQDVYNDYDTYDSAVVAAETEEEARFIHPSEYEEEWNGISGKYDSWPNADNVKAVCIGIAVEGTNKGVICASFNAG
jgi:hypothetical protein